MHRVRERRWVVFVFVRDAQRVEVFKEGEIVRLRDGERAPFHEHGVFGRMAVRAVENRQAGEARIVFGNDKGGRVDAVLAHGLLDGGQALAETLVEAADRALQLDMAGHRRAIRSSGVSVKFAAPGLRMVRSSAQPLALSELYKSKASFGFMFWCTTALTAASMAFGACDWKMLRPMSTPAAPCCTALEAMVSASSSGSFLPPAITIGTGQDEVTVSKPSST